MATEKELARSGYTGFHDPKESKLGADPPYKGMDKAPESAAAAIPSAKPTMDEEQLESMKKAELQALAETYGLEVKGAKGKAPVKADYVKALKAKLA